MKTFEFPRNLSKITMTIVKIIFILVSLYFFICSLSFLSDSFRLIGGKNLGGK